MPGVLRKDIDSAGGPIIEGSSTVFVNGYPMVFVGCKVQPHPGGSQHMDNPVMVEGSPNVFVGGIAVCRQGDKASCGHEGSPGSSTVFCN